jgi:hypothetical protein
VTGGLEDIAMNGEIIARAKKDLARRRGISGEKVVLRQIEAVTWPDTSLGYPQAGKVYAQIFTPGYRLVLSDGTTDFEYHTDNYRRVVLYRKNEQRK